MKNDPGRVRVSGPLSAYRDGFAEELARQGYTSGSAQRQMGLLAHLSRWLDSRGLGGADLTPECVEEFLEVRRAEGYTIELSRRGVLPLLVYLRALGVAPVPPEPVPCTPAEMLLRQYGHYLAAERGLAPASIEGYLSTARLFLSERERPDGLDLAGLTARDVTAFVVGQCRSRRNGVGQDAGDGAAVIAAVLVPAGLHAVPAGAGGAGRDGLGGSAVAAAAGRGGGAGPAGEL